MSQTITTPDTQTVELVDNELRAFLVDIARLGQSADSLRISVGPRGMRLQVDGGAWTPAFGYLERRPASAPADLVEGSPEWHAQNHKGLTNRAFQPIENYAECDWDVCVEYREEHP